MIGNAIVKSRLYSSFQPYLSHYGILGQKWGVRRFQNSDRTWTPEGKIRYGRSGVSSEKKAKVLLTGNAVSTKLSEIDHQTSGSTKAEVAKLLANSALDIVTLNPVGAAMDLYRAGSAISAAGKEKRAAKRIAKDEIDEKTGLPLKSKPTTAEQDAKMTNPGYKNFNTNTKNNCVLCSTTFELRRRGFDVTASKAAVGYTSDEYTKWFKGAKSEFCHGNLTSAMSLKTGTNLIEHRKELNSWAESKLLSQGEGARGYLSAVWGHGGGHSMAYEVKGGQVIVYDAQCGKKKSLKSIANTSVDIGYTRLDDKEPNYAAMKKAGVI